MYSQLIKHPEIWMPPVKELHFFDRSLHYPSSNALATSSPISRLLGWQPWERPGMIAGLATILKQIARGNFHGATWWSKWTFGYYNDNWYSGLFSQAVSYNASGEITPSYSILDDGDVAQIKALNAGMKLFFLIRNPIERAWSAIRFDVDRGYSKINLDSDDEIICALKMPGMVLRGDYERTLDIYLRHFDSSQILVCFYDAITYDPVGLLSDITTFLDVAPFEETAIDNETRVNVSPARKMSKNVRDYLLETYAPMINGTAEAFGSYATMWGEIENPFSMNSQRQCSNIRLLPAIHP